MAIIPTNAGIGDDTRGKIIVIFPAQVERRRHRFRNVARGAKSHPDHLRVGLIPPRLGFISRNPVPRLFADGVMQRRTLRDGHKSPDQRVSRS